MSKKTKEKEKISFLNWYGSKYKLLLFIPLFFLITSFFFIFQTIQEDGTPIYRDISLKGGLSAVLNIDSLISSEEFLSVLNKEFSDSSFSVSEILDSGKRTGFIVDTNLEEEVLLEFLENYFQTTFVFGDNYSSNFISPTLSNAFFLQAVYILLISFVLMSLVILLYFKKLVPSFAVVLSAFFDVIVTIGVLDAFGFEISVAGIGALLMIIGYSIDTDVLLTNRLIKEFGHNYIEKAFFAFKTGVLMSFTTLIAGCVALILTNSEVIFEIALILVIGLLVDFISTWFQNTGLLLWWLETKG